jgi:hypothetical protein
MSYVRNLLLVAIAVFSTYGLAHAVPSQHGRNYMSFNNPTETLTYAYNRDMDQEFFSSDGLIYVIQSEPVPTHSVQVEIEHDGLGVLRIEFNQTKYECRQALLNDDLFVDHDNYWMTLDFCDYSTYLLKFYNYMLSEFVEKQRLSEK